MRSPAAGHPHGVDRTLAADFHAHPREPGDLRELARTIAALAGRKS